MNKHVVYKTKGVCASKIEFDLIEGTVRNIIFENGCAGNTAGVAKLAEGRKAEELIGLLKGVDCRGNNSCPNQLALAIEENWN